MKPLLTLTLFLCTTLVFGQKSKDYLIAYTDSNSGEELTGFKSRTGKIMIKAKFSHCYTDTFYTMAIVLKNWEWVGIDRNEKIILKPFIYDNGPDYVAEGLFRFVENKKIGFANLAGQKKIPAQFDFATPFADGLSAYTLGGHEEHEKGSEYGYWKGGYEKGYLNKQGQRFKKVTELKQNRREAWTTDNKHVLLNSNGQIIRTYAK